MGHPHAGDLDGAGVAVGVDGDDRRRVGRVVGRRLAHDGLRRLVASQPFERTLAHVAVAGPATELDLGHQVGFDELRAATDVGGHVIGGRRLDRPLFQFGLQRGQLAFAEAGADAAAVGQMIFVAGGDEQRGKGPSLHRRGLPADDDELLAHAALDLQPALVSPGTIGRVGALRHDPFQLQFAGVAEGFLAVADDMVGIVERPRFGLVLQQRRKALLPLGQRLLAQVLAVEEQKVEGETDDPLAAPGKGVLKRAEVAPPLVVEHHRLAVDQRRAARQVGERLDEAGKAIAPVEAGAGVDRGLAGADRGDDAVAVELDLVQPPVTGRRRLGEGGQFRRHELRRRQAAFVLCPARRPGPSP